MPRGTKTQTEPLRILLYGPSQCKKTLWSFTPSMYGYRVIYLNGEQKTSVIQLIPEACRDQIDIINCYDTPDGAVFAETVVKFLAGNVVRWDDDANRAITIMEKPNPQHAHYRLSVTKLGLTDVLVIDSWTTLIFSLMWRFYMENGLEIEAAKKQERDSYGYQDRLANWVLSRLGTLPCHVIVIAHQQRIEITRKEKDEKGKMVDVPIGEQRIQPISSSRPNAEKLAKHFSDVLFFELQSTHVFIDARAHEEHDGGSRTLNTREAWDKLTFGRFMPTLPTMALPSLGCQWYAPGDTEHLMLSAGPGPALVTRTAGVLQAGGAETPRVQLQLKRK